MSQVYEFRLIERLADRIAERVAARLEGRITAVDPEVIARVVREELGIIRLSADFKLLMQALMEVGVMRVATHALSLWLNPSQVVKHVLRVPRGYVYLLGQVRVVCDPDHALSFYAYIDGDLVFWDDDVVQAKYLTPITPMEIGALLVLRDKGEFIVVNKTSSTAYFSYQATFVYTTAEYWSRVTEAVSDAVAKALNIPTIYRRTG
jgi:hypothetical protein